MPLHTHTHSDIPKKHAFINQICINTQKKWRTHFVLIWLTVLWCHRVHIIHTMDMSSNCWYINRFPLWTYVVRALLSLSMHFKCVLLFWSFHFVPLHCSLVFSYVFLQLCCQQVHIFTYSAQMYILLTYNLVIPNCFFSFNIENQ